MSKKRLKIGMDASRCKSGGAYSHLIGVLSYFEQSDLDFEIHIWTHRKLYIQISHFKRVVTHNPLLLNRSLFFQIYWQWKVLKKVLKSGNFDLLFTVDASSFCNFFPQIVLSQDLLSYEPGIKEKYKGLDRLRLELILKLQNNAFRRACGVIFLSEYTSSIIQKSCGNIKNKIIIPHGIGEDFKKLQRIRAFPTSGQTINCIYISNTSFYKHKVEVVEAIEILHKKKYNIHLTLIGGGQGSIQAELSAKIFKCDPNSLFIFQEQFVDQEKIQKYLINADLFIFASSCEAFGITLLEAMAVGLPIACSNRSGLPELLKDGGIYFNPESSAEISSAVEKLIIDHDFREKIALKAKEISNEYSWTKTAIETFEFISKSYNSLNNEYYD